MSGPSIKDFNPDSFTLEKYVEKLAQLDHRTGLGPLSKSKVKPFDAQVLLESFEQSAKALQELAEKNKRRVDKLGHVCLKQEKEHAARIGDLQGLYEEAFKEFQVVEDRITYVSTKVVHLGDQLESSNNRRTRAMEAQNLMEHLAEFEKPKLALPIFTDPGRKVEAADLIYKLQTLASELPVGEDKRYLTVKANIAAKYAELESQLVDAFIDAQRSLDTKRMRQFAQVLSSFPLGYQKIVENYIHHNIPLTQFASADDMFTSIEDKLQRKIRDQIKEVFDNPEVVMTKYIQAIMDKVIQKRIESELRPYVTGLADKEKYLVLLYNLYKKAMKFQERLGKLDLGIDLTLLAKLTRVNLFSKYLSTYSELEVSHLARRSTSALNEFQDMVGISKKAGTRLTLSTGKQVQEETYVSQEVCTSILHEAKNSIKRAKDLLVERELSDTVKDIYFTVLDKLCVDHFHTALDIAQTVDPKMAPVGYFTLVVGNINSNMHLIEKLFRESIMPCIYYPAIATACVERKRDISSKLEQKIEAGIEKTITQMLNQVKQILTTTQKRTDYKPEVPVAEGTKACGQAVNYIGQCCHVLRQSLDGKNLEVVLMELGIRLHRVVFEHIQQFTINELGAMIIICDMNDYRKVMKEFKNSFLDELFENLQTLCNIFIVKAENLSQVCSEEPYANFDRSVLQIMIQLRGDYKTAKLQKVNF